MSEKALRMLKHMRMQIIEYPAPYVVVRGAAVSIGVDPSGSECDGLVDENCCRPDTSSATLALALPRTGSIDSPTGV